jgi:hypothetical protein
MRLRRTLPFKTMRLPGRQSQWKNYGFPQFSWVFLRKMPIFAGILRDLPDLGPKMGVLQRV